MTLDHKNQEQTSRLENVHLICINIEACEDLESLISLLDIFFPSLYYSCMLTFGFSPHVPYSLHTETHTLVACDGDELLSAGGEAVDTRSLYPGFSLGVVFKGAVHACGQVRNIPCLENQL